MTLMDMITARQLIDFIEKPIKSALKDSDTLMILVHRHKQNDQEELTKNRISINIAHNKSMIMAKTMPLLIRYIMTRIFRKTFKNEFKETNRYDFVTIRKYDSFREEKCMNKKFTIKSQIFWRKIKAFHPINDIKIT